MVSLPAGFIPAAVVWQGCLAAAYGSAIGTPLAALAGQEGFTGTEVHHSTSEVRDRW